MSHSSRILGGCLQVIVLVTLVLPSGEGFAQGRSSAVGQRRSAAASTRSRDAVTASRTTLNTVRRPLTATSLIATTPALDVQCPDQEADVSFTEMQSASTTIPIEVDAQNSGWQMALVSQDLFNSDGVPIASDCLLARDPSGSWEGLSGVNPLPLVLDGDAGSIQIQMPLRMNIPDTVAPGEYSGEMTIIAARTFGDPQPLLHRFQFRLRLCMTIEHEIQNTKNYLHFGNTNSSQRFQVEGAIHFSKPVRLFLCSEGGQVNTMPMGKPFLSTGNNGDPIPMNWQMKTPNDSAFRTPDEVASDGSWVAWDIPTCDPLKNYSLECEVTPEQFQAPGDYNARFKIEVLPQCSGNGWDFVNDIKPNS